MFPLYLKIFANIQHLFQLDNNLRILATYFNLSVLIYRFGHSFDTLRSHHAIKMNAGNTVSY